MFRRSTLDEVGLYDTNTMTEDIDLTMKILAKGGNKNQRIEFRRTIRSPTPTRCLPSRRWCRQRYRWKYGQDADLPQKLPDVLLDGAQAHRRAVVVLPPFAIWQEVVYLIEPMVVTIIIGVAIYFHLPMTLVSAIAIISSYLIVNILGIVHLSPRKDKLVLSLMSPLMYVFFYLAVGGGVHRSGAVGHSAAKLRKSISEEKVTGKSPERTGQLKGGRHRAEQVAA